MRSIAEYCVLITSLSFVCVHVDVCCVFVLVSLLSVFALLDERLFVKCCIFFSLVITRLFVLHLLLTCKVLLPRVSMLRYATLYLIAIVYIYTCCTVSTPL